MAADCQQRNDTNTSSNWSTMLLTKLGSFNEINVNPRNQSQKTCKNPRPTELKRNRDVGRKSIHQHSCLLSQDSGPANAQARLRWQPTQRSCRDVTFLARPAPPPLLYCLAESRGDHGALMNFARSFVILLCTAPLQTQSITRTATILPNIPRQFSQLCNVKWVLSVLIRVLTLSSNCFPATLWLCPSAFLCVFATCPFF